MLNESTDLLRTIADQTDGRAIVSRNDPMPELAQHGARHERVLPARLHVDGWRARRQVPRDSGARQTPRCRGARAQGLLGVLGRRRRAGERAAQAGPAARRGRCARGARGGRRARRAAGRSTVWMGAARGAAEKAAVTLAWETTATAATNPADAVDRINITAHAIGGELLFKGAVPRDPELPTPAGRVTFDAPPGAVRVRVVAESAKGQRIDSEDVELRRARLHDAGPDRHDAGRLPRRTAARPAGPQGRRRARADRQARRSRAPSGSASGSTRTGRRAPTPTIAMRLLNSRGDSMAALPPPATREGSTLRGRVQSRPAAARRLPHRNRRHLRQGHLTDAAAGTRHWMSALALAPGLENLTMKDRRREGLFWKRSLVATSVLPNPQSASNQLVTGGRTLTCCLVPAAL